MLAIILGIGFAVTLIQLIRLKMDLAQMAKRLGTVQKMETNLRITTQTFEKNITNLANGLNQILERQQKIVMRAQRTQKIVMRAQRTNREFRQGIANVSHDLRTPLTSAMGYLQMLKSGNISDEKKLEYVSIIEGRLESLTVMMQEMFDYTKIAEGKIPLNVERVEVWENVRDAVVNFYGELAQGGFQVQLDIPETPFYYYCDRASLGRVLQNLLKNVIVHGTRTLEIQASGTELRLKNHVKNGEALELDRLFDRFYTTEASRTSQRSGLGLAIVKELLGQMNSTITASLAGDQLEFCIRFGKEPTT